MQFNKHLLPAYGIQVTWDRNKMEEMMEVVKRNVRGRLTMKWVNIKTSRYNFPHGM